MVIRNIAYLLKIGDFLSFAFSDNSKLNHLSMILPLLYFFLYFAIRFDISIVFDLLFCLLNPSGKLFTPERDFISGSSTTL